MNIVYLISKLQTLKIAHLQLESKKFKITNKEKTTLQNDITS